MEQNRAKILIVEDEPMILEVNCRLLQRRGYQVSTAESAAEAFRQLEEWQPDLLILDIMLPDGNGLDICRRFREKSLRPILFLSGKGAVQDRIEGLRQGGDYYLSKPCHFDEFLAVIEMLLARSRQLEEHIQTSRQLRAGSLTLNLLDGHAYRNSTDIGLTRTEFSLLRLLMENPEKIFSVQELYQSVWGSLAGIDTGTVRRHIFNLRAKISADTTDEYDIVSIYGKGYLFTCR